MRSTRATNAVHPLPRGARRGSTIIVAVGVLAVLALVAVSYALAVRTDRAGVSAYEGGVDLESSSRIVRDEISSLLAADLFGNKIVTSDIPIESDFGAGTIRVWPRMFEDGESFDAPRTSPRTFDTRTPDQQQSTLPGANDDWVIAPINPTAATMQAFFPSAPDRDDAWLSPSEPFNRNAPSPRDANHFDWTSWGQFSNLLSAYRWVRTATNDRVGMWVRDDGRYADLGQFFLSNDAQNPIRRRGDPGAPLAYADDSNGQDDFTGLPNGPEVGIGAIATVGGPVNFTTDVFGVQLNRLGELHSVGDFNFPEFDAYDERFFTDTDGDYRADARWQTLPSLDGLFGMRWVVAARIIDNSAMVNVNTAIEFQDPVNLARVGDARTPADVDLTRLVRSAHLAPDLRALSYWGDVANPDLSLQIYPPQSVQSQYSSPRMNNNLLNPINQHLIEQLGLDRFTTSIEDAVRAPRELVWSATSGDADAVFTLTDILLGLGGGSNPPEFTTRVQRYMANRYYGVSPLQPVTDQVTTYPITAEAELRAFFGVNNYSAISKVEQRFDYQRLDSGGTLSGPFRTKEGESESPRNYSINPSNPLSVRPNIFAIATDTRRHLTTVSGAGDFSPVPVLNRWAINAHPVFEQPYNARINFHDIPRTTPDPADPMPAQFQRKRVDRNDLVRDSFQAFAWALAPLAGHTPLMAPLSLSHTGWSLATTNPTDSSKFFYGGDAATTGRGPAYMLSQQTGTNNEDPGAAYAILRAASLAVNLADATDDDRINDAFGPSGYTVPTGATQELPTVARLYNIVHPTPYDIDGRSAAGLPMLPFMPIPGTPTDMVVRMGVSFPWGDLRNPTGVAIDGDIPPSNIDLLPKEYVGEPLNGVTLVGLDRQPFLREVATVAVYADSLALLTNPTNGEVSAADEAINPDDINERIGSIIAWEVGNPWPQDIDIAQYRLALAQSDSELLTFDWTFADSTIPAGGRVIFYAVHWEDGDLKDMAFMDAFEAQWRADIETRLGQPLNLRRVADVGELCLRDAALDLVPDPIPFQDWTPGSAVGVLYIDGSDGTTAGPIPGAGRILVDRISVDGGGLPVVLSGAYGVTPAPPSPPNPAGRKGTGVMTMTGSVARPTESVSAGFPAFVLERPSGNVLTSTAPGDILDEWVTGAGGSTGFEPVPGQIPAAQGPEAVTVTENLGEEDKGSFPINVPSFQLFVPNTELRYTSELLQLTAFTHMYVHPDGPPTNPDTGAALGAFIADPAQAGPGTWRTVSEQLGADGEIYRDATMGGGSMLNPYLGVLDPTRFVLASGTAAGNVGVLGPVTVGANEGLPEALAVPLALRVLDCFEPLWTPDWRGGSTLVQGRVNINTANEKTLRMLPLVDPLGPIGQLQPQSAENGAPQLANDWRVPLIMAYRDRVGTVGIPDLPADMTRLMGLDYASNSPLRRANNTVEYGSFSNGGVNLTRGFVTPGELAILDRWTTTGDGNLDPLSYNGYGFVQLGSNAVDDTGADVAIPAIDVRREVNFDDGQIRPTPLNGGSLAGYEGMDDPEERLAIYRAISNIATTRSDVYTAYFKIRGYAPQDIEAVSIPENPPDLDVAVSDAMKMLSPRFEGRYLAVFDRSNVRTPVDRPKVLLFLRLPD